MLQLIGAAASAAPAAYDQANKLVSKVTSGRHKDLKSLVVSKAPTAAPLAAELLVRGGLSAEQLNGLMVGFGTPNAKELMAHVADQVLGNARAVDQVAAPLAQIEGVSNEDREAIFREEIKQAIDTLGLRGVDDLERVAIVLNTLTTDRVRKYKEAGLRTPRLGYV